MKTVLFKVTLFAICICAKSIASPVSTTNGVTGTKLRQSPIDLLRSNATRADMYKLEGLDVHQSKSVSLKNDGHTAVLSLVDQSQAHNFSQGGGNEYKFAQLHFHWGSDSSKGSEHTFEGQKYPLEMHLVHFNTKYGSTFEEARQQGGSNFDTLAVLGVLFEVSAEDNSNFTSLISGLSSILDAELTTEFEVDLMSFLPSNKEKYYRYDGSLTTEPYNEIVRWTVFMDKVTISESQMDAFRKLKKSDGTVIGDNFRETQKSHGRMVLVNERSEDASP